MAPHRGDMLRKAHSHGMEAQCLLIRYRITVTNDISS